jgi:hypothetical protein
MIVHARAYMTLEDVDFIHSVVKSECWKYKFKHGIKQVMKDYHDESPDENIFKVITSDSGLKTGLSFNNDMIF